MADSIVVGSLNIDLVVALSQIPSSGQTRPEGEMQTISGGKRANLCRNGGSLPSIRLTSRNTT
jgi:sugar/nucleoside kinase (ribokinase family)